MKELSLEEELSDACDLMIKLDKAAKRLIEYHNKLILKVYPDANVKSHTKGCPCEVCEMENLLYKGKG